MSLYPELTTPHPARKPTQGLPAPHAAPCPATAGYARLPGGRNRALTGNTPGTPVGFLRKESR